MPYKTKEAVMLSASRHEARTKWLHVDQASYKRAKRMGWFEEAVAHMRSPSDSQRARSGRETRSVEAKANMSAAKLGTTLSSNHKKHIGVGLKRAHRVDPTLRKSISNSLRTSTKKVGAPRGWTLTQEEAEALGVQPGKVPLTPEQMFAVRTMRNRKRRKRPSDIEISGRPPALIEDQEAFRQSNQQ